MGSAPGSYPGHDSMFRRLIEAAPEAVAVICDHRFVYVNPRFLQLLGYDRLEEIVDTPAYEFIHPDDRRRLASRALAAPAFPDTPRPPDDFRMQRKGGDYVD